MLKVVFGLFFGVGLLVIIFSRPLALKLADICDRVAESKRTKAERAAKAASSTAPQIGVIGVTQIIGAVSGTLFGWSLTGLMGMAILLGGLGALLPPFLAAPRHRRYQMREALAWASWSRQLAELARSGSGLLDALSSSVEHAPNEIAHIVRNLAVSAEVDGLDAALDEFVDSGKVWQPEIAAGLRMAATAGGMIADPLFELCSRINDVVELHRAKNESVVQLWAQTIALLSLTGGVVAMMYANNPSYFDPYRSGTGQAVLFMIALILLGSTSLLVYHSVVREENSVLVLPKRRNRAKEPI